MIKLSYLLSSGVLSPCYDISGGHCPLPNSTSFEGSCAEMCSIDSDCGYGQICCYIESCVMTGTSGNICVQPVTGS